MNELLAAAIFFGLLALAGSIVVLATAIKGILNITVQAPTALLPERVQTTLDAIDAKLTPALVRIDDEAATRIVQEAVELAERSTLKGPDKFRLAKSYVVTRINSMGVTLDERDAALRIEAAVAKL